jgi:prephenate dehydrogenase
MASVAALPHIAAFAASHAGRQLVLQEWDLVAAIGCS